MGGRIEEGTHVNSEFSARQDEQRRLATPPDSETFSRIIESLVMGKTLSKTQPIGNSTEPSQRAQTINQDKNTTKFPLDQTNESSPRPLALSHPHLNAKRLCRAPPSKKFAHPCFCGHYKLAVPTSHENSTGPNLPPAAYSNPLHLYEPTTKRCLPTSRTRDMLLRECHLHHSNNLSHKHHGASCYYDDLVCDPRRSRCVCKPTLHLFVDSNSSNFACLPIGSTSSPDGRVVCKPGQFYNSISRDCQRVFDVNELPPNFATGVSATQFSFVTIVLIWVLLIVLIVTAKLRKLRTSDIYRSTPSTERRVHRGGSNRHHPNQNSSAWLHPFIAAVNGRHHMNQHRTASNLHGRRASIDESGNFTDTDLFLFNGSRTLNEMRAENDLVGSQQSLSNPPPKFEEIYSNCPDEQQQCIATRPPSNEDLPTYDEAMKLRNTMPDPKQ